MVDGPAAAQGADLRDRYEEIVASFQEISLLSLRESATLEDVLRDVGLRLVSLLGVTRFSVFMRRSDGRFQGLLGHSSERGRIDTSVRRLVAGGARDPFTSEIIEAKVPVRMHDAAQDGRHTQRTVRTFRVTDTMGVPLVVEGDVIGVIFVDDEGRRHAFSEQETDIAQAFAGLAALAVWQRWLFQRLEERTRTIAEQRSAMDQSRVVHEKVMRAILEDRPVTDVLGQLSGLLGKRVVHYGADLVSVVAVAPDGSVDERTESPDEFLREAAEALESGDAVSVERRVGPASRLRRLLVRLTAGESSCVGYLALVASVERFTALDTQAMEQASLALALKVSAEIRRDELWEHERQQFLADMVHRRRDAAVLTERAVQFDIDTERRHALMLLRRPADTAGAQVELREDEVRRVVGGASDHELEVVASTGMPGADVFLLELTEKDRAAEPQQLRADLDLVFAALRDRFPVRHMIVSAPTADLRDLPAAYTEVQETVALLSEVGAPTQWAFARDLHAMRLVVQRGGFDGALEQAERFLEPLRVYDEATGSALIETLRVYIDRGAQIRGTATALAVHENTVRYRLSRIREISSFDPERIEDLAGASLALRVAGLAESRDA